MSVVALRPEPDLYPIDKSVPLPNPGGRPVLEPKVNRTLLALQVGESFFIPENTKRMRDRIRQAAHRAKIKVSCRHVIEGGADGIRIWRRSI